MELDSIKGKRLMMKGIIYAYKNKINGRYYVGQTTDPDRRQKRHLSAKSKCPKFCAAIKKYGADAFEYIVLISGVFTKEELNKWERYFILRFNAKSNGYNLTFGGDGLDSTSAKEINGKPERKKAASEKAKKQFQDKNFLTVYMAQRKKISTDPAYIEKQRQAMAAYSKTEKYKRQQAARLYGSVSRQVVCIETGTFFESSKKASDAMGGGPSHIAQVCDGKRKSAGGYTWRDATPEEIAQHKV